MGQAMKIGDGACRICGLGLIPSKTARGSTAARGSAPRRKVAFRTNPAQGHANHIESRNSQWRANGRAGTRNSLAILTVPPLHSNLQKMSHDFLGRGRDGPYGQGPLAAR